MKIRISKTDTLPDDLVLLQLSQGALLVSNKWAVFCRIPEEAKEDVRRVIKNEMSVQSLSENIVDQLRQHGFFESPRVRKVNIPSIRFQITNECNLKCEYCCTNSGTARPNELTEDEWKNAVDQALAFIDGPLKFSLLGGEPLRAPYLAKLASYIQSNQQPVILFTNGSLLNNPQCSEEIADLIHGGMEVRVSIAGPNRETCDRLSGTARFDDAIAGINRLNEFGAHVHVSLMLFPESVADTVRHLPTLRKELPSKTSLSFGIAYCGGREHGQHMFPSRAHLEKALDSIALEAGQRIPYPLPSPVTPRKEACHCAYGDDMHIRSDGLLFSCFKMEEPLGSFRDEPLARVWRRSRQKCRPATELPFCSDCPLATLCGGGCRSENILYTGKAERPLCGPWRVQILSELLAEDRIGVLQWPTLHLINEARERGFEVPRCALPKFRSLNIE
ncbi:MAG: radical SAM protein [Myxococcota bacterium]|nr:radical SAM protein [Myxococcota bacterium]